MSGQLKIPSLGRPFNLGMLYNRCSEKCTPGWDFEVLKSNLQISEKSNSKYMIFDENTLHEKYSSLNIDDSNLKLSLMSGMIEVEEGAPEFLNDQRSTESEARVTLRYTSTTRIEEITMEHLDTIPQPKCLNNKSATHVVTGIIYGYDAFFVFDRLVSESEKLREVSGNMKKLIECIPSLSIKEESKTESDNFRCKFYNDLNPPFTIPTFDEAVKVYKNLPLNLNGAGDKSVPKFVILSPLSQLHGRPQQKFCSTSIRSVCQVEQIMESYHTMKIRGNDLKNHKICFQFVHIEKQLSNFLMLLEQFKLELVSKLSDILPRIRGSEAGEKELTEMISSVRKSPFDSKEMEKYLRGKTREITKLDQTLKNMRKEPMIKFLSSRDADLIALTMDNEIDHVVCFAFNVTSETSSYIESMESYLSSATVGRVTKPADSKEWFDKSDVTTVLRSKSTKFINDAQVDYHDKNIAFRVIDYNEDADESGPVISWYTNGVPNNSDPPGKLKTPEAAEVDPPRKPKTPEAEPLGKPEVEPLRKPEESSTIRSECIVQTLATRPAETFRKISNIIETTEELTVYRLPTHKVSENAKDHLFKFHVGKNPAFSKPERVLMLVGATGAGKTTLINGIANFVFGVTWEDNFRFKVITYEGALSQAHSQTKSITAYTFHDTILPYDLTVIDTPGFGDTGGIERDKSITRQIKTFFSEGYKGGIDQLHGIGFVTQASLGRLTPTQKYIFDAILAIYGKDIVDNIFLMATFADAGKLQVLEAARDAKIPFKESFKFNNSALFASNDADEAYFNSLFWTMGCNSFDRFFTHFSNTEPKSLALTREVLKEREHLEALIPGLQQQVDVVLSQLDTIQQEERILKQHEDDIAANKNFTYEIEETKFRKVDLKSGIHTTTCRKCNITCHLNCKISTDKKKERCCAMKEGNCTVCPDHCHWKQHSNVPYVFEYYAEHVTRTYDHQKTKYETAKTGKERVAEILAENNRNFDEMQVIAHSLLEQVQKSNDRLDEIALKPNPLSKVDYIYLLIESEKIETKPGWKKRVEQYKKLCKNAETALSKVPKDSKDMFSQKTS